jgi:hypothetical protein
VRYPAPVATLVPWPHVLGVEDLLVQPSSTSDLGGEIIPAAPDGAGEESGEPGTEAPVSRVPAGESED